MRRVRVSITFPYSAKDSEVFEKLYKVILATIKDSPGFHNSTRKPVLVVNRDSISSGSLDEFYAYGGERGLLDPRRHCDVLPVYAVDTCQMWLSGFGKILDDNKANLSDPDTAVLQLPGDLKDVQDFPKLVNALNYMALRTEQIPLVIGDFDVGKGAQAKQLIDVYGTYPLLYNWFPTTAAALFSRLNIKRPRSEFFAVSVAFLERMLRLRKFAYEQTLAFLIYAIEGEESIEAIDKIIATVDIGIVGDYGEARGFREATDQIERTERMLKVLWRTLSRGEKEDFDVDMFEALVRRSTSIRDAALVTCRRMLASAAAGRAVSAD